VHHASLTVTADHDTSTISFRTLLHTYQMKWSAIITNKATVSLYHKSTRTMTQPSQKTYAIILPINGLPVLMPFLTTVLQKQKAQLLQRDHAMYEVS